MTAKPECLHYEIMVQHGADGFTAACMACGEEVTLETTIAAVAALAGMEELEVPSWYAHEHGRWTRRP